MTKLLTIELPEELEQQLVVQAHALNAPLESLVVQTLTALSTLIQSLQDDNPAMRQGAAAALGAIGTEAVVPLLVQSLQDDIPQVRQTAEAALRKIGTETALTAIKTAFPPKSRVDRYDPITPLIGTLHLNTTDLAENHDRYLGEALTQELNSGE
ncbi:HEAT repeat domain-containing protein [Egbenema bharatensis]|uniref:HEAT repeat domain-containing protein n=1 Tax=Egbenema bharatensis TaxID=3463334 RepID=UPI003A8936EA